MSETVDIVDASIEHLRALLSRFGLCESKIVRILEEHERFMRIQFGGDSHYVCGDRRMWVFRRNEAVRRTFNGCNHDEVCRRFGISKRTLYRIIRG